MTNEAVHVQWFPGHMTKTRRMIQANLKMVDAVVELIDARIPQSSRNPEIDTIIGQKPRMILLNKSDMADPSITSAWLETFKKSGIIAIPVDCRGGNGIRNFVPALKELLKDRIASWDAKGMVGRPMRIMIVGIPNVGKSSFINRMVGKKSAKVEDRPGVTRGKQWVSLSADLELLDTPGVLWPKFEDKLVGERLAFTGAVRDEVMDLEALSCRLLENLREIYPNLITERYNIDINDEYSGYDMLLAIGKRRGFLISGGEINTERTSIMLLDEYRGGKLGRISLEKPKV